DLERTRRGSRRTRVVHGIVSLVWLRPVAVRGAVRGEAQSLRRAAQRSAGHVERESAAAALESDRLSPERNANRNACSLGGRGWQPGVGRSRRALRPSAYARHYRRQPAALYRLHGFVPPDARTIRQANAADRRALTAASRRGHR